MPVVVDKVVGVEDTTVMFGDSLSQGAGGKSVLQWLSNYMPLRLYINEGIGGQTWQQIACRQGSKPVFLTVSGSAFTGATPVAVTSISTQLLSTLADTTTRKISGLCADRECILTRTSSGGVESYTIVAADSSTSSVPANSQFFPDQGINTRSDIQIFWWGRNNSPDFAGLADAIDAAAAYLLSPRRFIVVGVLNALSETSASSGGNLTAYGNIIAINNTLRTNYPDNFVESTPPSLAECTALNFTPTAQDNMDITNGTIPTSMRADSVHLNDLGYQLIAYRIFQKYKSLGWY